MSDILVVDDNFKIFQSLEVNLVKHSFNCSYAVDTSAAMKEIKSNTPDIVLLDLSLGAESGLDLLSMILESNPDLPVIMITGYATYESAVKAIKLGAIDFLEKPLKFDKLIKTINNALANKDGDNRNLSSKTTTKNNCGEIITCSEAMINIYEMAKKLASTNIPILITGESGTGKELIADYIHENSLRNNKPLVKLNCSALTEQLLDSELFGHEKGAFTGAMTSHTGVFEQASGGSLHLDEIGDMMMQTQVKILRAIQYGEIRHIGGTKQINVDVRFIASTNKDLNVLIEEDKFREDLLYRLNASSIHLPPLRERKCDIPILVDAFVKEFQQDDKCCSFSDDAIIKMQEYDWNGNIRELRNIVMVTMALSNSDIIPADAVSLPSDQRGAMPTSTGREGNLRFSERIMIIKTLKETHNNRSAAAEKLGISRKTLYNKIDKYGL